MNSLEKKILKKIIPEVALKNLLGLKKAVSYYPDYVYGNGKIRKLKNVIPIKRGIICINRLRIYIFIFPPLQSRLLRYSREDGGSVSKVQDFSIWFYML